MKKLYSLLSILFISCVFVSCSQEDLDDFINKTGGSGLTDSEIIDGLKTALTTGTDSSTTVLSKANGYFKDEAVKILLPQELGNSINEFRNAKKTVNLGITSLNITGEDLYNGYENSLLGIKIPSIKQKEEALILGLNQAAELAAKSAGPVFKNAITTMTITDGLTILNGADTAATSYLRGKTFNPLVEKYEPIVDSSLKVFKVVELYENYVTSYNDILNTNLSSAGTVSSLLGVNAVTTTDISKYGTEKALNGLFLKVSNEEQKIRLNPFAYVSEILRKVFGNSTNQ